MSASVAGLHRRSRVDVNRASELVPSKHVVLPECIA